MGLGSNLQDAIVAAGAFNGTAGPPGVAFGERGGVVAGPVGGAGTGIYTITLDGQNAIDATEGVVLVLNGTNARAICQVVHTTDLVKTLTFRDGAAVPAAIDCDFHWMVVRFAP
jgi:hypothetical protein